MKSLIVRSLSVAAAALLIGPAAASAVPVNVTVPTAQGYEGSSAFISFDNPNYKTPATGSVEILASPDAILDPTDAVVGTAVFDAAHQFYASAQILLNDRVANPGGAATWTLFYRPVGDIQVNVPSSTYVVQDEDARKQPMPGTLFQSGRKLNFGISFFDGPATAEVRLYLGEKKLLAKKKIKANANQYVKVKFTLSAEKARRAFKAKKVRLVLVGTDPQRDLFLDGSFKKK